MSKKLAFCGKHMFGLALVGSSLSEYEANKTKAPFLAGCWAWRLQGVACNRGGVSGEA